MLKMTNYDNSSVSWKWQYVIAVYRVSWQRPRRQIWPRTEVQEPAGAGEHNHDDSGVGGGGGGGGGILWGFPQILSGWPHHFFYSQHIVDPYEAVSMSISISIFLYLFLYMYMYSCIMSTLLQGYAETSNWYLQWNEQGTTPHSPICFAFVLLKIFD